MRKFHLIATAAFGLEGVVAAELRRMGYEVETENGRVRFCGTMADIARCNLWLRVADRLLIEVGSFKATSFEELFEGVRALPWEEYIPKEGCFPVSGKAVASQLMSVPDCQAITKKAIVERLKQKYPVAWFEEAGETYKLEVGLLKDVATLTLDCSGAGLHRRGYRPLTAQAPLRETLAAALVLLCRWHPDRTLWDPMCGSGTIPIEAALIGRNIAPGMNRTFAAEDWRWMDKDVFRQARAQALEAIDRERELHIIGTDIDERVLSTARFHAKSAKVEKDIHIQCQPLREMRTSREYGFIVCNPPYGERMGQIREAEQLYREMAKVFATLPTWGKNVITSYPNFERVYGRRADRRRKLYNGKLQCQYYQFLGPRPPWLERARQAAAQSDD